MGPLRGGARNKAQIGKWAEKRGVKQAGPVCNTSRRDGALPAPPAGAGVGVGPAEGVGALRGLAVISLRYALGGPTRPPSEVSFITGGTSPRAARRPKGSWGLLSGLPPLGFDLIFESVAERALSRHGIRLQKIRVSNPRVRGLWLGACGWAWGRVGDGGGQGIGGGGSRAAVPPRSSALGDGWRHRRLCAVVVGPNVLVVLPKVVDVRPEHRQAFVLANAPVKGLPPGHGERRSPRCRMPVASSPTGSRRPRPPRGGPA